MPARDIALAALVSVVWGFTFVANKLALEDFSAPQLTLLRFCIAALPVLWLTRPALPWRHLAAIGLTLFAGQFLLLFFAYEAGMPPGLASVTQQLHAFFTVLLAALFLAERPSRRQWCGIAVAFAGLGLIALSVDGGNVGHAALALALASALSWGIGNLLVKTAGPVAMPALMAWASLVPPLPALALDLALRPEAPLGAALADAGWTALAAVAYIGGVATIFAYAVWGGLLARHPAALVAPFALLAPVTGMLASAAVFGELFTPLRYAGMAAILAGLTVLVLPLRRPAASPAADA